MSSPITHYHGSSALNYFLNASLDTEQSTFALACMKSIDGAMAKKKTQVKMPSHKGLPRARLEEVIDLLEIFYFNEREQGVEFLLSTRPADEDGISLFDLHEPPEDPERVVYNSHRKSWKSFALDVIRDQNEALLYEILRKPKNKEAMSFRDWCRLATDLSQFLQKKHNCRIYRGLNDRWVLRHV